MDADHSLAHHERLRSRGSIRQLFESGKSGFIYPLRYMWFAKAAEQGDNQGGDQEGKPENELEGNQNVTCSVLFTVPKRFHKRANRRNLLRRRIKESYRLQKEILLDRTDTVQNIDLAIVYSTKEVHSYKTINNAVRKILENIAKDL